MSKRSLRGAMWLPLLLAACGGPPAAAPPAAQLPAPTAPAGQVEVTARPVHKETTEDLIDALSQPDAALRDDALEMLALREDTHAVTTLTLLLTDADEDIREETVDALAEAGTTTARELMELALFDPHPAIREAARDGLEAVQSVDR